VAGMDLNKYPNTKTVDISRPLLLKGGKVGILAIHGFTGSPHDMTYLANRLNESGFTVSVPRLSGHGTCAGDFVLSNWKYWLRRVIDDYYDLSSICDEVYITGLSMGGLLTLILASMFNPKKIVTIAAAIDPFDKRLKWSPILSLFVRTIHKEDPTVYDSDSMNYLKREYWNTTYLKQARSLYKLIKITKKRLPYIKSDILVLASENDKTVTLKAADIIYKGVSSGVREKKVFKKSSHVMTNDVEKKEVADEIIKWFQK
jgi:carboxylesterase